MLHLARALHHVSTAVALRVGLCGVVVLAALSGVVALGVAVVRPKREIDTIQPLGTGKAFESAGSKPAGTQPLLQSSKRILLGDLEWKHAVGRQQGIRSFRLSDNRGPAERTRSCYFRRLERYNAAAPGTSDLHRLGRDWLQ